MVSHHDIKLKFDNLDFKCYQNTINKKIPLGIFLCNLDQYNISTGNIGGYELLTNTLTQQGQKYISQADPYHTSNFWIYLSFNVHLEPASLCPNSIWRALAIANLHCNS